MTPERETIVLITGGTGSIGFETAKDLLLSSNGYCVIIGARNPLKGEQVLAALKRMPGCRGSVSGVIIDVNDVESIARSAEEIGMVYGRLDILVNTAGSRSTGKDVVSNLRRALSANVVGAVAVAEYYKHLLRRSTSPRIVFVSPSHQGAGAAVVQTGDQNPAAVFSEYGISQAALKIAMTQIAKTYVKERGLENLKVFGADTAPPAIEQAWGSSRADEGLAASVLRKNASLVANVARGAYDDKAGMVISTLEVGE